MRAKLAEWRCGRGGGRWAAVRGAAVRGFAAGQPAVGSPSGVCVGSCARLLLETEEKNYVIAGQVGYADPNYFSYVFKRKFGVSPSKYRTEHTKREE